MIWIMHAIIQSLNDISATVSKVTKATEQVVNYFMHYAYNNQDAKIIYKASNMILQSDSDAAYLVAPKARSCAGGYHYLGSKDGQLFYGPAHVMT